MTPTSLDSGAERCLARRRRAGRLGALALGLLSVLAPAVAGAAVGPLTCAIGAATPPTLRAEGIAELVGDVVLTCTGGTPTADGVAVPRVNINVFLSTAVTSRVLYAPWSEALLLVDEPAPGSQAACATVEGVCAILGNGTGVGIYDGSAGRPNVFQGQQSGYNSVSWRDVPLDPPGAGTRKFRLTNIRADASALGPGPGGAPAQVMALVSLSGDIAVPINPSTQALGVVQPSLALSLRNALNTAALTGPVALPQCTGAGASTTRIATLRFTERFSSAFRTRAASTSFSTPTAVADQNTPGVAVSTESGFFSAALVGDEMRGDLGVAGLADSGTRLKAVFSNVPAGVSLFVDINGTSAGGLSQNTARLTTAEAGGFVPVVSGALPGTAQVALANGTGSAVWEITDAVAGTTNSIDVGVYATYGVDVPAFGTAQVAAALGPTAAATAVPRFADTSSPAYLLSTTPCGGGPPELVAAVLPASRSVQVGNTATAFATVINTGSSTATACTITRTTTMSGTLTVRTANAANQATGTPPVDIPVGVAQNFILAFSTSGPVSPVDVRLNFDCANSDPAAVISGLNTIVFSASSGPVPDIVALAATVDGDGIAEIPGTAGNAAFAVATVNVGATGNITVSADTGSTPLPVRLAVCQTDPATGACLAPPAASVTASMSSGSNATFGAFVSGTGMVAFDPAVNRVFVRFKDGGGLTRGSTSVAVRTQ